MLEYDIDAWPQYLADEVEIAQYVSDHSTDVCAEMVEEFFFDSHAELRVVPISEVIAGDEDHNARCAEKEAVYADLSSVTRPPILLDFEGRVADGNHRLRDALSKGENTILAYVAVEGRLRKNQTASPVSMRIG